MIVDVLDRAHVYRAVGGRLARALEFLRQTDLAKLPNGRHDIAGAEVYAMAMTYETKPASAGVWEAHRRYADVQFVIEGAEQMGYAPLASLAVTKPYESEKDCELLAGSGSYVTVRPGTFVVFWPWDAHMPGVAMPNPVNASEFVPGPVRKVVVKVLV